MDKYAFLRECCSAIITDVCDKNNINFTVITDLRSPNAGGKLYGITRNIEIEKGNFEKDNLELGLGILESLKSHDVLFVKGQDEFAYFGELMGLFCSIKDIGGVVIDGRTRDSDYLKGYNFPIYSRGYTPLDIVGRGRVRSVDSDIVTEKYTVKNRSFLFSDSDACVILSLEDFESIIDAINDEITLEKKMKKQIKQGLNLLDIVKGTKPI